jgi:hypothetical protein
MVRGWARGDHGPTTALPSGLTLPRPRATDRVEWYLTPVATRVRCHSYRS